MSITALREMRDLQLRDAAWSLTVDAWAEDVKRDLDLKVFEVWPQDRGLYLSMLVVRPDRQRQGVGSEAMRRLVAFADQHGCRVLLTPATRDGAFGTTSYARLVRFYKRFGFHENKGRHRDFTTTAAMIRTPLEA